MKIHGWACGKKSNEREAGVEGDRPVCLCVLEVCMVGGLIPQPDGDAGGHDLHMGLGVKTEWS